MASLEKVSWLIILQAADSEMQIERINGVVKKIIKSDTQDIQQIPLGQADWEDKQNMTASNWRLKTNQQEIVGDSLLRNQIELCIKSP